MGQVAQNAGYTTAEFGKLEWGFATTPDRIQRHGWDYHFGYYDHVRCHGFYPPFLFENGEKVELQRNTRDNCGKSGEPETPEVFEERWNMDGKAIFSENIIMDKLLSFIDTNNPKETDKPFFIYLPGISIDCVVIGYDLQQLHILLLKMKESETWLLPGGFVQKNEDMDLAASRILEERTGIKLPYLKQLDILFQKRHR